jgi:hypothetical protein
LPMQDTAPVVELRLQLLPETRRRHMAVSSAQNGDGGAFQSRAGSVLMATILSHRRDSRGHVLCVRSVTDGDESRASRHPRIVVCALASTQASEIRLSMSWVS